MMQSPTRMLPPMIEVKIQPLLRIAVKGLLESAELLVISRVPLTGVEVTLLCWVTTASEHGAEFNASLAQPALQEQLQVDWLYVP